MGGLCAEKAQQYALNSGGGTQAARDIDMSHCSRMLWLWAAGVFIDAVCRCCAALLALPVAGLASGEPMALILGGLPLLSSLEACSCSLETHGAAAP
jgi:hypothetical protein